MQPAWTEGDGRRGSPSTGKHEHEHEHGTSRSVRLVLDIGDIAVESRSVSLFSFFDVTNSGSLRLRPAVVVVEL